MYQTSSTRRFSGFFKRVLFTITFMLFLSCCFIYQNHYTELRKENNITRIPEQINPKNISAVVLTSLPFVLAIKNLIIDREEK